MTRILAFIGAHLAIALAVVILWTAHVHAGRADSPTNPNSRTTVWDQTEHGWSMSCDFYDVSGQFAHCMMYKEFNVPRDLMGMTGASTIRFSLAIDQDGDIVQQWSGEGWNIEKEKTKVLTRFVGRHRSCKGQWKNIYRRTRSYGLIHFSRPDKATFDYLTEFTECNAVDVDVHHGGRGKPYRFQMPLKGTYEVFNTLYNQSQKYLKSRDM